MNWAEAYREADAQIAHWLRDGVSAADAARSLDMPPGTMWLSVRQHMATWVKLLDAYEMWE